MCLQWHILINIEDRQNRRPRYWAGGRAWVDKGARGLKPGRVCGLKGRIGVLRCCQLHTKIKPVRCGYRHHFSVRQQHLRGGGALKAESSARYACGGEGAPTRTCGLYQSQDSFAGGARVRRVKLSAFRSVQRPRSANPNCGFFLASLVRRKVSKPTPVVKNEGSAATPAFGINPLDFLVVAHRRRQSRFAFPVGLRRFPAARVVPGARRTC